MWYCLQINYRGTAMLKTILIVLIVIFVIVAIAAATKKGNAKSKKTLTALGDLTNLTKRSPLTPHEQRMYLLLTAALPDCVVLAQVALSSLITTTSQSTRNRFDRKVADFVICTRELTVITVIELDDKSHDNKRDQDADRDLMLQKVGYTTTRYKSIPTENTIRADIATLTNPS
jgi:very-short-patch-repair endonuclease